MAKLHGTDVAPIDKFGSSVSMDGSTLIVGANYAGMTPGSHTGVAYIFYETSSGQWDLIRKFTGSDAEEQDSFGRVALDGDWAIVGATGNLSPGSAYVFQRDAGGADNWGEVEKLVPSDPDQAGAFGCVVSLSGDWALISDPGWESPGGEIEGAVYLFHYSRGDRRGGRGWTEMGKLALPPGVTSGVSNVHCIDEPWAVLGHPMRDYPGGFGRAYVYHRDQGGPNQWGFVKELIASDAEPDDRFGTAVALDGDTLIVGAPARDDHGTSSGNAYIFYRNQGGPDNWGEVKKLTASDSDEDDYFGGSLAISGDNLIVSARRDSDVFYHAGAAYLFQRNHGGADNWGEVSKLVASDGSTEDLFGSYVAVSDEAAIITAPDDDDGGESTGSAYAYVIGGPDCNDNGIPDVCDIADGTSADCNENGIPDECESPPPCPWDCEDEFDCAVGIDDLVAVINHWGPCADPGDCPWDCEDEPDGTVGIDDLVAVINHWGPCP